MFFRGSRYEPVATAQFTFPGGRVVQYKRVRYIGPAAEQLGYIVKPGERLDLIAHRFYGDPEQFWRICDENRAVRPQALAASPGMRLLIPIPMR